MPKRSARYQKALKGFEDSLENINLLFAQHGKTLQLYEQLQGQLAEAETELKEASKEEATKDGNFRSVQSDLFSMTLTENRTVKDQALLQSVGEETYNRLATIKKYVTLSSLEKAAELGVVPMDLLGDVIEVKGFSAKITREAS